MYNEAMSTVADKHAAFCKFLDCIEHIMSVEEVTKTTIGGVAFSIDTEGPWAGVLSFSPETSKWDAAAVIANVKLRLMMVNAPSSLRPPGIRHPE